MVKPWSVGVVPLGMARRAKNITKMTVEVLNVRIATQDKAVLSKAESLKQDLIVERLGTPKIRYCDVDMVDSGNFSHGSAI